MIQELVLLVGQYGLAIVFANVLLEQIGLPVPAIPTLVVAGALSAEGTLSAPAVFTAAFVASMLGDRENPRRPRFQPGTPAARRPRRLGRRGL